jgi:hypothetical protein
MTRPDPGPRLNANMAALDAGFHVGEAIYYVEGDS